MALKILNIQVQPLSM